MNNLILVTCFCAMVPALLCAEPEPAAKFKKLYTFFTPKTEADVAMMKKYHVGATSTCSTPEAIKLLNDAGIKALASFGPVGWHLADVTPEQKNPLGTDPRPHERSGNPLGTGPEEVMSYEL